MDEQFQGTLGRQFMRARSNVTLISKNRLLDIPLPTTANEKSLTLNCGFTAHVLMREIAHDALDKKKETFIGKVHKIKYTKLYTFHVHIMSVINIVQFTQNHI